MKKEDIEKIMDMSFLLGRKKYAKDVSLVDIYDLSCRIWEEIQNEPKENYDDIVEYILIDRKQLEELEYSRNLRIVIDADHKIEFMYKPNAFRLESGEIVDSDTYVDLDIDFEEELYDWDQGNYRYNKFEMTGLGTNISNWIIEHITKIQEVLGFDIQNLEKNKELENGHPIDLYGEDNFGNAIVFYGDGGATSDKTLGRLLYNAILSYSEKAVWIAPVVDISHENIINWLNNYHYGHMSFYLILAERIATLKNKTDATLFQLIAGPKTGWRDWV